jgi:hypothetical protein
MKHFKRIYLLKYFKPYFIIRLLFILFLPVTILLSVESCKHDPIYSDVCFDNEVLPIFLNNCAISGCHDANTARANYVFTDYDNIMKSGISSRNASGSKVYQAISGSLFAEKMPPDGALPTEKITLIRSWIEAGAKSGDCNASMCDTNQFTYGITVKSIIDTYCVGCHKVGSPSNLNLDGYTNVKAYLDVLGNKDGLILDIQYSLGNPMPKTGKMPDCKITQMMKWINAGYLNN